MDFQVASKHVSYIHGASIASFPRPHPKIFRMGPGNEAIGASIEYTYPQRGTYSIWDSETLQ